MPSLGPKARHTTTSVTDSTMANERYCAPPWYAANGISSAAITAGTLGIWIPR